ncbi:cytochrome P450 71A4-like protein [Tanacetum coccineum]
MVNDLERQMMEEKLMLRNDDGKPLKKVDDLVNADSDSEVEEVFNEITYNEHPYDDDEFDDCGLIDAQMAFANKFDISLRVLLLVTYLKWFSSSSKRHKNSIPSPWKLPVIGNFHQLIGPHVHRTFFKLAKKHGPLMLLHLGNVPVVIVSSMEAAREIMKTHDYAFLDRGELGILRKLTYDGKDIALSDYGEYWRKLKSLVVVHLLSNKQVQSFQQVWEEEITLMIENIGETSGSVFDLSELLLSSVNSILCRVTFGRSYSDKSFINTVEEFKKIVVILTIGQYIPWLSWVDRLRGINVRTEKVAKKFDEFLESVIEECLNKNIERSTDVKTGTVEQGKYFIDILLDKQKEAPNNFRIDRDTIKAILLDMFSGAADTTFTTLEWALSELIRNPRVMKKLQDEVNLVALGRPKITEEDIGKLNYLHAVLKETMRLHAPAPLVIRASSKDVKVMGYDIKAKTRVFVNLWALGQDPTIWEEHEEFKPERFINSHFDYRANHYGFIPFGGGKRGCPGINFANTLMELILANVVYKFDFALANGERAETLDMSETSSLTISRKNHLLLVATPC